VVGWGRSAPPEEEEEEEEKCEDDEWVHLIQDRVPRETLVNEAKNLRIP
jgi:hypothetical protein